jgi:hypothetical protein
MDCGHQCHEVGEPWIAEDPNCPIHGINGIGEDLERIDDMRAVIRQLVEALEGHRHAAHCSMGLDAEDEALIERAQALL